MCSYPVKSHSHLTVVAEYDELAVVHDGVLFHYLRWTVSLLHLQTHRNRNRDRDRNRDMKM
jgi:hypothetical protein